MAQINLRVDPETEAILDALRQHFRASSRAEVLKKGIRLLEMAKEVEERGGSMAFVEDAEGGIVKRFLLR